MSDGLPFDLPESLQGRDLDEVDPAEFAPPPLSREEAAARLADLGERISSGETAAVERAELIARLSAEHWTQAEIAKAAGISQQAVAKSLSTTPGGRSLASRRDGVYLAGRMIGLALHLARTRRGLKAERTAEKMAGHGLPVNAVTVARLTQLVNADLRARRDIQPCYREEFTDIASRLDEAGDLPAWPWANPQLWDLLLAEHHQAAALTRAVEASRKQERPERAARETAEGEQDR